MKIKLLAFALFLLPSLGQEAPNRFKKTADLPKTPDDLPVTVVSQIEHFLVPKETLHQWTAKHPDQKITHKLVSEWVTQKQATLAQDFLINTRLEKQHILNAGQTLTFPVQFVPPNFPGEWFIPDAFDHKNLGHSLDVLFRLNDRQQLQCKFRFDNARLSGSKSHFALIENTREPDDLLMPIFKTFRQQGAMTYRKEVNHLTGVFNSLDDEKKALLVFSKAQGITLDSIPKEEQPAELINISSHIVDVPSAIWREFSHKKSLAQLRTESAPWIAKLLEKKEVTLFKELSKTVTQGETKSLNPDGELLSDTKSFKPTDASKKLSPSNPLIPVGVEPSLRKLSLQVTPEVSPSGHILLAYLWQIHAPLREYVIHRVFDGEDWIPDATAPCRTFFNLTGAVFVNPGEDTLIGALPVKSDPGKSKSEKVRLFFLKAE